MALTERSNAFKALQELEEGFAIAGKAFSEIGPYIKVMTAAVKAGVTPEEIDELVTNENEYQERLENQAAPQDEAENTPQEESDGSN